MKLFDVIWIVITSGSFVGWLMVAKDFVSWVIAFIMSVIGIFYLLYKTRLMRAEAILKEEELKKLGGKV